MPRKPLTQRLLPTLFEDDDLVAVDKPWGIDTGRLGNRSADGVSEILVRLHGLDEPFTPINRLSRYESGVLLLGKNAAVAEAIRSTFRQRRVTLEYAAVVVGRLKPGRVAIGAEHGASRGRKQRPRGRGVATTKPDASANATTINAIHGGRTRTLIRCRTSASTTHAFRAQLRAARLRVLGDRTHQQFGRPMTHQMTCLHLARMTFEHPLRQRKMSISAAPPDEFRAMTDGLRDATRPLKAALVRRLPLLLERDVDSYRLLTGDAEDFAGLTAERFGPMVILEVQAKREAVRSSLQTVAQWYRDRLGVESVVTRWNIKETRGGKSAAHAGEAALKPLVGKRPPESFEIRERGLKFQIRPGDGRSVGLFLDHRDNRARVRSMARGKDVLNLFAYTCGFSVAAASGRSASTVSVDLSNHFLDWGRENFAINSLPLKGHEFIQADSFEFIRQVRRRERRFDLIVVDPPSFAHGRRRGRDFSVARDLPDLVAAALEVLKPDGVMMISTNLRKMSGSGLRERIKQAAGRRRVRVLGVPPLPPDYAVDPYHAKTMLVSFT